MENNQVFLELKHVQAAFEKELNEIRVKAETKKWTDAVRLKVERLTYEKYVVKDKAKTLENKRNAEINKVKSSAKSQERKNETRKKILIGAMISDDATLYSQALSMLDSYLKKDSDRALFNLTAKEGV
jgi:hypothetical protein